jgi:hypothetical protein
MAGPLTAAIAARIMTDRAYRRHPEGLTPVMIKAFGGKMVFYAAYVSGILGMAKARPVPFVVSFTIYFLALHIAEAARLHRLSSAGSGPGTDSVKGV